MKINEAYYDADLMNLMPSCFLEAGLRGDSAHP